MGHTTRDTDAGGTVREGRPLPEAGERGTSDMSLGSLSPVRSPYVWLERTSGQRPAAVRMSATAMTYVVQYRPA